MKVIKTDTLIIGAGPAGCACAMELSKKNKDFILIEKNDFPGGLSATYVFEESDGSKFYTDNGPHRFFSKNQYLYDFIENLINEDWILVNRKTRQYVDGVFYNYPINAFEALKNIGLVKAIAIFFDYLLAKVIYGVFKKPIITFKDYAYSSFGKSLAEFNIINYTEKIWGIASDQIHPDWAIQRIKGLNLFSIFINSVKKIFSKKTFGPKSLIDQFYYPSKGTSLIYEKIIEKIKTQGYQVYFNSEPVSIEFISSNEVKVLVKNKEQEETLFICKNIVESVPITNFINLLDPKVPDKVLIANSRLRHRNQVYLFITLNKNSITDDQWIYFPSKKTDVARVSEMKNFSASMSPKDKTSLFVEFFCFENDEIWNSTKEELFEKIYLEMGGVFFSREEVRNIYLIKKRNVYPVYDLSYQDNLKIIKDYLDGFNNLFYIGRPGRFRYNNQDHSLEMGILAAKSIVDGINYDIESVGQEKEYFEKGIVPDKK